MRLKIVLAMLLAVAMLLAATPLAAADDGDDPSAAETVFPLSGYPPSADDNVALQWNEEALQCIRVRREPPVVVARALFIVHASMYDAWASYDSRAEPLERPGDWQRQPSHERTAANKREAVSHAAHVALHDLFPSCGGELDQQLAALGFAATDGTAAATAGRQAGQRVVSARRDDGANQAGGYADTSGYQPVNTPDSVVDTWRWQPQQGQTPLTPHWGQVRPFYPRALEDAQVDLPRTASDVTIDDIIEESANLNDRTKMIAEYWADGPATETPPGHWNVITQWVSRRHGHTLDQDVKLLFALNGALLDASITVWFSKYRDDFARPVSVIRTLRAGQTIRAWGGPGQGTQTIPAEQWRSYIPTPPFPEYVSGHSAFSTAAAQILKDVRGLYGGSDRLGASVTFEPGDSVIEPGVTPAAPVTLTWAKFEDAAWEAGISRRYGGIHWLYGDLISRELGRKMGERSFDTARRLWDGG